MPKDDQGWPAGRRVAIVGVGYATTGRHTGRSYKQLTAEAALAAMADAGMRPCDIDGVTLWSMGEPEPWGESAAGAIDPRIAADMLGISPVNWFSSAPTNFGDLTMTAIAAVRAGFCHTCIVLHPCKSARPSRSASAGQEAPAPPPAAAAAYGDAQFSAPFGASRPGLLAGLVMRRHMEVYGSTQEQYGLQQVSNRYNASLNEEALLREPLTLQDYLDSRWISRPVRLLDCDYPCDTGGAVIVTTEAQAYNWKKKPVFVESAAMASCGSTWEYLDDLVATSLVPCAQKLWERTSLRPGDVDCAMLYDGFACFQFAWLEALGFCGAGEAGPFAEDGHTALGGSLPINTDGGVCNVGRRHGASHCIEAVRQLRGECGARQVENAQVSLYTVSHGPYSHAALLTAG